jgi:hypothetical protein
MDVRMLALSLKEAYAKRASLDLGDVCHFLSQAINKFRRVYICIDALDEMDPTHRPEIIQILGNLLTTSDGSMRLFITSRPQGLDEIKTIYLDTRVSYLSMSF